MIYKLLSSLDGLGSSIYDVLLMEDIRTNEKVVIMIQEKLPLRSISKCD